MSRCNKGYGLCGPTHYVCTAKGDTPGPKYALPTLTGYAGHETVSTRNRAPCYSLRDRTKLGDGVLCSPGPAAYLPTAKQTRSGNDGSPSYSLADRHKDLRKNLNPGPGSYAPERHNYPACRTAPEYSMGKRLKSKEKDSVYNPAPNAYSLPSRIGTAHPDLHEAPQCYMTFRDKRGGFHYDSAKTPGPAAYSPAVQNVVKNAAPEFTIRPRCQLPDDKTQKPGPAAHRPEDCPHSAISVKKGSPAYSFGRKHHEYAVSPIFTECNTESDD